MKVAVIGAGTMGSGIAQAFAQCAEVEKVYLCDIKEEFAQGGFNKIKGGLDRMVGKGKMEQASRSFRTKSSRTLTASSHPTLLLFPSPRLAQACPSPSSVCTSSTLHLL